MSTARRDADATAHTWGISDAAARLHAASIVADMTVPWRAWGRIDVHPRKLSNPLLVRMADSGVTIASLTLGLDDDTIDDAVRGLAQERFRFRRAPDRYVLVRTVEDIRAAKRDGKLAIMFNFRGTGSIAREPGMVEIYHRLGVRHMLLAHDQQNWAASGCRELHDPGLSRFGRDLVREMNRVGVIVDLAHTGYCSSMEALEIAAAPAIFSRANPAGLCKHERSVEDDQIRACARKGGVIGIGGLGTVGSGHDAVGQMLDRIDYVARLVGPRHVGLGFDHAFYAEPSERAIRKSRPSVGADEPVGTATGSVGPEGFPLITEGLLKRRYSEDDVRGILGENFLRVCGEVWR